MSDARKSVLETIRDIRHVNTEWITRARQRQRSLTKPPGSLGRLEEVAERMCAIQERIHPDVSRRRIVVFAADHGVTVEGVSAYPSEVTAQMVVNFVRGGAAVNALAGVANADVWVVDVGVARPISVGSERVRLVPRRVREGTRNMAEGPAMSEPEMLAAIAAGIEQADQAAEDGVAMIGLGEMGIGNTTAASAVTAALTGLPPSRVTGRGTGVNDANLARKVSVVERARNSVAAITSIADLLPVAGRGQRAAGPRLKVYRTWVTVRGLKWARTLIVSAGHRPSSPRLQG